MRPSTRRALLWQVVSVLLYLGGMGLFLIVALSVFLAPPEHSFANATSGDTVFILVSVALLVGGRFIGWRFGLGAHSIGDSIEMLRDYKPEQSKLEELGYRVEREPSNDADRDFAYEDGTVYRVCPECGTNNDSDYRFCGECSAKLPE